MGTFYTTINSIGPFQLAIHVVQNHRAGEEKSQWNKTTNKGKYHLKILCAILFVLSQCDVCTPAWPFCITWMASSKGPIQSHKPVLALLLVFPHEAYISKPFQRQWKFWTSLRFKYLISNLLFSKIFQKFLLEKHFAWEVDTKLGRVFHRNTPGKKSKLYSSKWRFLTFFYFWYVVKHANFILGLNFIFLCFKLIIIHYYTQTKKNEI